MVADGDHFAADDDSADTASGHAARLTPTGKSGRTDEAPRDPRRGASPRYAQTSRRPLMISGHHSLISVHGYSPSSAVPLTCPQVAACKGYRRSTAVSR